MVKIYYKKTRRSFNSRGGYYVNVQGQIWTIKINGRRRCGGERLATKFLNGHNFVIHVLLLKTTHCGFHFSQPVNYTMVWKLVHKLLNWYLFVKLGHSNASQYLFLFFVCLFVMSSTLQVEIKILNKTNYSKLKSRLVFLTERCFGLTIFNNRRS